MVIGATVRMGAQLAASQAAGAQVVGGYSGTPNLQLPSGPYQKSAVDGALAKLFGSSAITQAYGQNGEQVWTSAWRQTARSD